MKLIPLTQGKFAKVDDDYYDFIMQWKWYANYSPYTNSYYAVRNAKVSEYINGKRQQIKMHRVILGITDKAILIDHINHDTLDNIVSNLRTCSHSENMRNRSPRINSSSKYLGVCLYKGRNPPTTSKWASKIRINKHYIFIGYFDTEIDAALSYDKKAKELFGEFANVNFKSLPLNPS